ncbi:hypothetical protein OLX02_11415 [Novosphingobium sp. KCTC 2891]|nr:hypothetical protein [Novosphingobium sp. KCTC 2891]MCW1383428.1 hypothetical protein [Novosphingobium sp. KCTC 2891]
MTAIRNLSAHIVSAAAALALSALMISGTVSVPQSQLPTSVATSVEYVA